MKTNGVTLPRRHVAILSRTDGLVGDSRPKTAEKSEKKQDLRALYVFGSFHKTRRVNRAVEQGVRRIGAYLVLR